MNQPEKARDARLRAVDKYGTTEIDLKVNISKTASDLAMDFATIYGESQPNSKFRVIDGVVYLLLSTNEFLDYTENVINTIMNTIIN